MGFSGPDSCDSLLGVIFGSNEFSAEAQALAQSLGLALIDGSPYRSAKARERLNFFRQLQDQSEQCEYAFYLDEGGLQLLQLNSAVVVSVDFCSGKADHRRRFGGGSGQLIAKAAGFKMVSGSGFRPRLIDATAGLGQDSFVLASLGAQVTMLERNPIVQCLLQDGLARARASHDLDLADVISRMSLEKTDAYEYLQKDLGENRPHIVYLDPMFPERKKSAQVKKEMQSFHDVVGADLDADKLLDQARSTALARVLVKRPKAAGFLADVKPDHQLSGKTGRYDIYVNASLERFASAEGGSP